jgi:hypothetical protein
LSAEEAARTAATATKATARDTAQAVAHEKAALEMKVADLEHDLGTATADLATAGRQFWITSKLAKQKLELNSALLKDIEKDGAIERLSEQLQSKS